MARIQKLVLTVGSLAALAACAQREEEVVYMEPEPIVAPAPTTKY